ncbi:MAG: hypothetical protein IJM44_01810 [Ruminococcus sp.]|nr:hypothetical protein [Ruminococcus sp.]
MKKAVLCALCGLVLAGCAEKSDSSMESVNETTETTTVQVTTEAQETTEPETTEPETTEPEATDEYYGYSDAPPTFPVPEGADPAEVMSHYTFKVDENGVWVYYDGTTAQLLDVDTAKLLDYDGDPAELLYHEDYNFDGWDDLFVPEIIFRPNTAGEYFRFEPRLGLFVIWQELNDVSLHAVPNESDKTLTISSRANAVDHKVTTYEWIGDELSAVSWEQQYQGSDGEIYINYYLCSSSGDVLYKREKALIGDDGGWLGTEEVNIE